MKMKIHDLQNRLHQLHKLLRDHVLQQTRSTSATELSEIVAEQGGDVIFAIDKTTETQLLEFCEKTLFPDFEFLLIAEGLPENGHKLFSKSSHADAVPYRLIIDPIDGTRPLMYDKRSAWILTGVAHNRGDRTNLQDLFLALQTEIPVSKQASADTLWAVRGQGAHAVREHRESGKRSSYPLTPSRAETLDQGFASFVRFFHGPKTLISRIDEALRQKMHGPLAPGKAWTFEDQYMSTGGQIYELVTGRDRFVADLRAFAGKVSGEQPGLCCHPYDLCTALIAESAGAILTDANGDPLDAPLDVTTAVDWIGYANKTLHRKIQPVLQEILRQFSDAPAGS